MRGVKTQKVLDDIDADYSLHDNEEGDQRRAEKIYELYKTIAKGLKDIIISMWKEATNQVEAETVPCNYSVIVFGSLAKESATPYSDIEFGILIEDMQETLRQLGSDIYEQDGRELNKKNKEYFRNVSALLMLKVMALGETAIPMEMLTNEKYLWVNLDDLIIPGLQFDLGGKTPLNRQRLEDHVDLLSVQVIYPAGSNKYDLIATPGEMAKYIEDKYFEVDKLLPIEIVDFTHLYGDKMLTENYNEKIWSFLDKVTADGRPRYEERARQVLLEGYAGVEPDFKKFELTITNESDEGKLYNVKQDIYRLTDRFIGDLTLFVGIKIKVVDAGSSTWDKIESLGKITSAKYDGKKRHNKYRSTTES